MKKAPRVFITAYHKMLTETFITISLAFRVYYFDLVKFLPVSCPTNKIIKGYRLPLFSSLLRCFCTQRILVEHFVFISVQFDFFETIQLKG